jgi:DNA repair protein SbcD/Mre11
MKVLHTSDWHLGKTLYDKKRYDEFDSFLNWLVGFIVREKIDALLISGDIFDTTAPSNHAQGLYYNFFKKMVSTGCRHIVVTGGNHDSPSFLEAPKSILRMLDIHVVASISGNIADELIPLTNEHGATEAIVCAVPFLRDRDIRSAEPGESPEDKSRKLISNIAQHYREVAEMAQQQRQDNPIPIIGMGHLFTQKGKTTEGDGVRELYVGTAAHVDGQDISQGFDYVALGHLHVAQKVEGKEHVRYCGSPIPIGFGEAGQEKKVIVASFKGRKATVTEHKIPCFRELHKISGTLDRISAEIQTMTNEGSEAWLEVEITEAVPAAMITAQLDELLKGSKMEILRIKNKKVIDRALQQSDDEEKLETMNDSEVFLRCLEAFEIAEEDRKQLLETYKEAIFGMQNHEEV